MDGKTSVEPKFTAVVVTHGRPTELKLVVDALLNQLSSVDSIVVMDNASTIRADQVLNPEPILFINRSEVNLGGAGGFANGLAIAMQTASDWFLLLDDDAIPLPNAISELKKFALFAPKDLGVLASAVLEDGTYALMHRRNFSKLTGKESQLPLSSYSEKIVDIDTASFVGFLVRRSVVEEVGIPDASYFLAYDDTEYSLRIKKAGWRLATIPSSKINHLRNTEVRLRTSLFGAKHYYNIRNRIIVLRQYSLWKTLAMLRAMLLGLALFLFSKKDKNSKYIFLKAIKDGLGNRRVNLNS